MRKVITRVFIFDLDFVIPPIERNPSVLVFKRKIIMADTTTGNLMKYLGLVGTSGMRTGSLVPRAQTPDAEARLFKDFTASGQIADADIWTKYNTVMKRPTTFESMLQLWEEMAGWDLVAAALKEIVCEAIQTDANSPGILWYQCNDKDFEEELNDMIVRLDIEQILPSQIYHVAALGNHFEKLEYAPGEGIMGMSFVHPLEIRRYWLERNRKCVGFRWMGHKPDKDDIFVMPDNTTPVERVSLAAGSSTEDLWFPWDFMHMRRMFRMRVSEHGEPIFAEADGIYKKLRLAVDQMVIHRAQVQPVRYAISIDTQEQTPVEQMKTIQRWRQALRSKLAFGQAGAADGLNSPSDFSSYYNSLALDTIIYLAQPKGFNNAITQLPGTADVPDVYDIELLTDLFFSIIGMPRSWLGGQRDSGGGGDGNAPSGKSLLAQDMRFLRSIKAIRQPVTTSYEWLGYFHAALKGKNVENLDIKAMMSPIGSLEDQMKMEVLKAQADVLLSLGDVMEKYQLPKEAWIEVIFKRYMHLPDDVVNIFITALPAPIEQQQQESTKNYSTLAKVLKEVQHVTKHDPKIFAAVSHLTEQVKGESIREGKPKRKRKLSEILETSQFKTNDVVISSFRTHPFELKRKGLNESRAATGRVGAVISDSIQDGTGSKGWDDKVDAPPVKVEGAMPDNIRKYI